MSGATETMERIGGPQGGEKRPGLLLLCAKDPERVPRTFRIQNDVALLGRDPTPDGCCIPQAAVSRKHARITRREGTWRIEDMASHNGTYVDGRRVGEALLQDRSVIRVGDTLFQFVADGIDDYAPYSLDGSIDALAVPARSPVPELVGGLQMVRVAARIETVAATELTVLVLGETGTGKEVVARALHRISGRSGPFVPINCAAVPTSLFESELFGFRKAAFTGADRDKPGILQSASGGTVLLDEIGDMPFESQAKLLRVLESREVVSLGSVRPEHVDVRFVCATNQELDALVAAGRFRADLHARIAAFTVTLPPLRERKEDLHRLVRHFLGRAGRPDLAPGFPFMLGMCDHDWPQNVRECEGVVRHAVATTEGPTLEVRHLPPSLRARAESYGARGPDPEPPRGEARAQAMPEAGELRRLLVEHGGNVAAVARALGKDRGQVHRLIQRHALVPDEYRPRRGT